MTKCKCNKETIIIVRENLFLPLPYLCMSDSVCWCPDMSSGCWWDRWLHSCSCYYPDIPPPVLERRCWDQTHWCWTINCFLCTRRDLQISHSPLNTAAHIWTLMMYLGMEISRWKWQESEEELENITEYIRFKSNMYGLINFIEILLQELTWPLKTGSRWHTDVEWQRHQAVSHLPLLELQYKHKYCSLQVHSDKQTKKIQQWLMDAI